MEHQYEKPSWTFELRRVAASSLQFKFFDTNRFNHLLYTHTLIVSLFIYSQLITSLVIVIINAIKLYKNAINKSMHFDYFENINLNTEFLLVYVYSAITYFWNLIKIS